MCLFLCSLQIIFAEKKTDVIIDAIPIEEFKQNNNYVYCAMEYQLYNSIGCSRDDIVLENFSDIHKMNYIDSKPIIFAYYTHRTGLFCFLRYFCICIPCEKEGTYDIKVSRCYEKSVWELFSTVPDFYIKNQ